MAASAKPSRFVGFGLGDAGGLGDVGVGKARRLGGGGGARGLGFQLELAGVGQRFDLVTLGVGRLLHVGLEFLLPALDFLLLQLDLLLLLDDVDLDFLGLDELAGLEFLQIVSEVGLGFLLIHRRLVLGDVGLIIALGLGDLGVGDELGFLAGLGGLRGLDHGVAVGFGLGDDGVAFDLGDARLAQGVEVALAVANVADGEADNAQAHVGHVAGGDFLDFGGEGVAVLVNILDGHGAQNGAQMALQGLRGDVLDFVDGLAQELLGGGGDGDVVALDLDLRHAIHRAPARLCWYRHPARLHINGQQFQRQDVHLFEHRPDEDAAAFDDAEADVAHRAVRINHAVFAAGDDQHLVGADLGVAAGPDAQEDEDDNRPPLQLRR